MSRTVVNFPVGDGALSDVDAYLRQHRLSAVCANLTLDHLPDEIRVWHGLIRDLRTVLAGPHNFEIDGQVQGHWDLAMRLEVVALSTSKVALDCCLGGLYVQGFMLARHLLETWQRLAYTFLYPETASSWLSPEGETPTTPNANTIYRGILRSKLHKSTALQVERAIKHFHILAHPDYGVITAHDTLHPGYISLGGAFNRDRARDLVRHATIAQMLILQEHRRNMPTSDEWQKAHHETLLAMKTCMPEAGIRIESNDISPS